VRPAIELARTKFIFLPADGARLTFIGDYSNHVDSMEAYRVYPNTISGFTPAAGPFPGLGYNTDTDTQPRMTVSSGGLSLRWDHWAYVSHSDAALEARNRDSVSKHEVAHAA
jgi:hypothetical protein